MTDVQSNLRDPKKYEITYFLQTESRDFLAPLFSKISATQTAERPLEKVSLAFLVRKQRQAFMGSTQFTAMPDSITRLHVDLSLMSDVLRYVIVIDDHKPASSQMQNGGASTMRKPPRQAGESRVLKEESGAGLTNEALEQQIRDITQ